MKTKMIITAAFAALTLGTASWAMADDNVPTICKCAATDKSELETKADKADKEAKDADKHYEDVYSNKDSSDEDKSDAKTTKKEAHSNKDKADKAAKKEEDAGASTYGACVCPNGSTGYKIKIPANAAKGNNPTSAFREVRGQ